MVLRARTKFPLHPKLLILGAIVLALFVSAFHSPARAFGAGWFQPVAADEPKVVAGIQQLRQLKLKKPVPIFHKTRAQAAQILLTEIKDDRNAQEQSDARVAAGMMLGRYHRDRNVKADSVKLYLTQVDAFYDFRKKDMVILEGGRQAAEQMGFRYVSYGDWRDDMILAHELTHALQDQNFDAGARMMKIGDNSDAALAFKSLIEGDATLAGFAYVRGGMDESLADFITAHLTDLPQVSAAKDKNVPDALSVPFLFQYAEGTAFAREAYRRGGWDSVDAAFRNPPESSAQIIDPELYFDHPTHPLRIKVDGYQKGLAGWNKVLEDTYGELALRLIMMASFGRDSSQVEVAHRWAGDRMVVLSHGKDETVIWIVAFNDQQGASLFANFYRQTLDRVDAPQDVQSEDDQSSGPIPHDMEQSGNEVLVIAGPGAQQFSALAPAIWQASEMSDPNQAPVISDDDQEGYVSRTVGAVRELVRGWLGLDEHRDPLKYNN
ncbi:MAG TPA: hypothetical protein VKR29_03080 [Candidatus Binataceae bacterium]|nr:hypothetical protein [Candidatus Binataceae bacterium]